MVKRKRQEKPKHTQVKFQKRVKILEPREKEQETAQIRKLTDEKKKLKTELRQKKKQCEKQAKNLRDQAKEIAALKSSLKAMETTLKNNKRRNSRAESRNDVENVKEKSIKLDYYFPHTFKASVKDRYNLSKQLLANVLTRTDFNQIEPRFEAVEGNVDECRLSWQVDFKGKHVSWEMIASDSVLESLLVEAIRQDDMNDLRQCLAHSIPEEVVHNPKDIEKIKELQEEIEMFEEKVKEVSGLEEKIATLKKDKGYLIDERDELQDKVDLMEENEKTKENLEIELEALQEELSDSNIRLLELEDKEKQCARLQNEKDDLERQHQSELDAEIKKKQSLEQELLALKNEVEKGNAPTEDPIKIMQLEESLFKEQEKASKLQGKLMSANFSLAQKTEDYDTLKANHTQLQQQMDDMNFSELESTLSGLRAEKERLQVEASSFQMTLQGHKDKAAELEERLGTAMSRLSQSETEKLLIEQKAEDLSKSESQAKQKIDSLKEKLEESTVMKKCLDLSCVCGIYHGSNAKQVPVFPDEEAFADAMSVINNRCRVCMSLVSSQDTFDLREIRNASEDTLMCQLSAESNLDALDFVLDFYSAEIALAMEDMPSHFLYRAVQANQISVVKVVLKKWNQKKMHDYYNQYFGVVYDRGGGMESRRSLASWAVEKGHIEMVKLLVSFEPQSLEDATQKATDVNNDEILDFLKKEELRLRSKENESGA